MYSIKHHVLYILNKSIQSIPRQVYLFMWQCACCIRASKCTVCTQTETSSFHVAYKIWFMNYREYQRQPEMDTYKHRVWASAVWHRDTHSAGDSWSPPSVQPEHSVPGHLGVVCDPLACSTNIILPALKPIFQWRNRDTTRAEAV